MLTLVQMLFAEYTTSVALLMDGMPAIVLQSAVKTLKMVRC